MRRGFGGKAEPVAERRVKLWGRRNPAGRMSTVTVKRKLDNLSVLWHDSFER